MFIIKYVNVKDSCEKTIFHKHVQVYNTSFPFNHSKIMPSTHALHT